MQRFQHKLALALVAASMTWGCARYNESSSAGTTIDPAEAAQTAVLNVKNENGRGMELRSVVNGQSTFIGSIGPSDSTSILLRREHLADEPSVHRRDSGRRPRACAGWAR